MISSANQPAGSHTIASGETSWARLRQFLIANHSSIVSREVTNENAVHLYSFGNWWLAFDRSLEGGATGQASSIIKVGLDASIEIIRK